LGKNITKWKCHYDNDTILSQAIRGGPFGGKQRLGVGVERGRADRKGHRRGGQYEIRHQQGLGARGR